MGTGNLETNIEFSLSVKSSVAVVIYNIMGQKIKELLKTVLPQGKYSLRWNGTDDDGLDVLSGVYFVRVTINSHSAIGKMVVAR